jgi:predicted esterase
MPAASFAAKHASVQRVTRNAFAYVPTNATSPAPLVVLLHGLGGDARSFLKQFKRDADDRGVILLSVQSSDDTWPKRPAKDSEADVANIKAAVAQISAKAGVDPKRTTIMGFSDGASYALTVGLAFSDLFPRIVAFSPGYAIGPPLLDTKQRIFIAHARHDPVLPASNTKQMAEALERAGYAPQVHWFNGGHAIDRDIKKAAFDFAAAP